MKLFPPACPSSITGMRPKSSATMRLKASVASSDGLRLGHLFDRGHNIADLLKHPQLLGHRLHLMQETTG